MADIKGHLVPPTIQAIYAHYEESRPNRHRPHLGGSQIGNECSRALWYQFHWADSPQFEGRVLRLFETGDREEQRLIQNLRAIGVNVLEVDPATGRQWTFNAFGGHFGVSLDGVGQGFQESKAWHLLEFKTMNAKGFAQLKSKGLQEAKSVYYDQVVIGMELAELDRTYHLTVCKDTDEIYGERIKPDPKRAEQLLTKAEKVIFSEEPLEKISERPDWYACKFCTFWNVCHGGKAAEVNCRTCLHSTAKRDGTWHCAKHDKTLTTKEQRAGCGHHLFRPGLVPAEQVDAGPDWVEYRTERGGFRNGPKYYTSAEIRANAALPLDELAERIRQRFGGEVVG